MMRRREYVGAAGNIQAVSFLLGAPDFEDLGRGPPFAGLMLEGRWRERPASFQFADEIPATESEAPKLHEFSDLTRFQVLRGIGTDEVLKRFGEWWVGGHARR